MITVWSRFNTLLLILVLFALLALIGLVATRAETGSLDPVNPPASTMQTLDDIPGAWNRSLSSNSRTGNPCASDRFQCVLQDQAVFDRETGLVWQRNVPIIGFNATEALDGCWDGVIGGKRGWRLPLVHELTSLLTSSAGTPALPSGHPFTGIDPTPAVPIWAWTLTGETSVNYLIQVDVNSGLTSYSPPSQASAALRWCVRAAGSDAIP